MTFQPFMMNTSAKLKSLIKNKNVHALTLFLFGIELPPKQMEIVKSLAFPEHKRTVISAYTRYGKSYAVAIGVCIYILFNKNKKINLIAPTGDQTNILRNYISEFIVGCDVLRSIIDIEITRKSADRLKKEVSKKRITFKNGNELRVFSAQGRAERLMGWGGDLIVMDESCLIDPEVYRTRISRMLGDNPNTMIVEIGNPFFKDSHMYEHWIDPNWHQIHIDWGIGVNEDRIKESFIQEQKNILTPMEFQVLYKAEFPDDTEDTLIKYDWIKISKEKKFKLKRPEIIAGLDVAEMGKDLTVLTIAEVKDNKVKVLEIHHWAKQDTMTTVGKVSKYINKKMLINVDATGVGRGVYDRLDELGYNAKEIKVGRSAITETDRFLNQKAEFFWSLRKAFEESRIDIPSNSELISQLNNMKYELTSASKIKIIDPTNKSPDFADSLMLVFAKEDKFEHHFAIVDV